MALGFQTGAYQHPGFQGGVPARGRREAGAPGKGRRNRRERRPYVIEGRTIWATEGELPGILETLLSRPEPRPEPARQPVAIAPATAPIEAADVPDLPAIDFAAWRARVAAIEAQARAARDEALLAALDVAVRRVLQDREDDEAEIEMLLLNL